MIDKNSLLGEANIQKRKLCVKGFLAENFGPLPIERSYISSSNTRWGDRIEIDHKLPFKAFPLSPYPRLTS
jgi:hypothetical protein